MINQNSILEFVKNNPEQFLKYSCERSLYTFVKLAWKQIESNPFQDDHHIKIICDELQRLAEEPDSQNLIINIPPRCSKSSLVAVYYPVWLWIKQPNLRILTASYSLQLATRDAVKSRRLIDSQWFQERWGDCFKLADDQNLKTNYENDKGGGRAICSPDSTTTGIGADIQICDDLLNAADGNSQVERNKVNTWYFESFYNRTINPKTAKRIIIGQRLHDDDIFNHIDNAKKIILPAIYDETISTHSWDGYSSDGDLLSPERLPRNILDDYLKSLKPRAYGAQYLQRPTPVEGNLVKRDWLKFYDNLPDKFHEVIQSWDLIFGTNLKTSDYVVGGVYGLKGNDIYLIDQVRGKWDFTDTLKEIRKLKSRHPESQSILIEQAANGAATINTLRNELFGITPIVASKNKLDRLNAVIHIIEGGNLYLPKNAPWVEDYIYELTSFTGTSHDKHDDQVDSLTQALQRYNHSNSVVVSDYYY